MFTLEEDKTYMEEALKEGKKALAQGEVPIGAVLVRKEDGAVIGRGYNRRNSGKNPLYHAEIIAINEGAKIIGDWRLEGCTMYVTIEPCPMCAGAIVQARIPRVVFGARNEKAGCCGSIFNLLQEPRLNHRAEIQEGVLEEECRGLMKTFFQRFRKQGKE